MQMFQTLGRTLDANDTLKIECAACGRRAAWSRAEAIRRLGPGATPADIRWRLACTGCKRRGRARTWV